jgi:Tfp pilus assembly protein FimT
MAIILSIAIPAFIKWINRYKIESDTKTVYSFIQEAREKAFAEKIKLDVELNGKSICYKCDSSDNNCTSAYGTGYIKCTNLNFALSGNPVNISTRGTLQGGPIYYNGQNDAQYDCVRVSDIRVKMEKCNGNP